MAVAFYDTRYDALTRMLYKTGVEINVDPPTH
jgi:hypothetical protein